jgi:hypothetical protein
VLFKFKGAFAFGNRLTPYIVASFAFRGIVCALISSFVSSMICLQVDFRQPFCFESHFSILNL